jgi:hypothetical protein
MYSMYVEVSRSARSHRTFGFWLSWRLLPSTGKQIKHVCPNFSVKNGICVEFRDTPSEPEWSVVLQRRNRPVWFQSVKSSSTAPPHDEISLFTIPQLKPRVSGVGNWALIARKKVSSDSHSLSWYCLCLTTSSQHWKYVRRVFICRNCPSEQVKHYAWVGNEVRCSKSLGSFRVEVNQIVARISSAGECLFVWCRSCCFGARGCRICIQFRGVNNFVPFLHNLYN